MIIRWDEESDEMAISDEMIICDEAKVSDKNEFI
jgi:hypothetical protein